MVCSWTEYIFLNPRTKCSYSKNILHFKIINKFFPWIEENVLHPRTHFSGYMKVGEGVKDHLTLTWKPHISKGKSGVEKIMWFLALDVVSEFPFEHLQFFGSKSVF